MQQVSTHEELIGIIGTPVPRVANKVRRSLHDDDRQWLAASPFCLVATADATGALDVSPKGDPAGFAHVLDETTIALPERPGNRRADGFHNVIDNPQVGLIFLIPGRGDTLRINGRARIVSGAAFFDDMIVKGHRPVLALVVDIDEVFYHCSKAFLRSELWEPSTWAADRAPSRAAISKSVEQPEANLADLERYYADPAYAKGMYT